MQLYHFTSYNLKTKIFGNFKMFYASLCGRIENFQGGRERERAIPHRNLAKLERTGKEIAIIERLPNLELILPKCRVSQPEQTTIIFTPSLVSLLTLPVDSPGYR